MLRLAALAALTPTLLLASALGAHAAPPSGDPEARAELAVAYGVDVAQVEDARFCVRPDRPRRRAAVVGRYREHPDSRWVFPALATYSPCPRGTCLYRLGLGEAARKVTPLAIVDLDAAETVLPLTEPGRPWEPLPGPKRPHWPALALRIERDRERPTETSLVLVSLRDPKAPTVLLDVPLAERWPDATEAEMRGPSPPPSTMLVGAHVERVVFTRSGKTRRVTLTTQPLDSRWSGCLQTPAYDAVFALETQPRLRFVEVPPAEPRPRPCH